MQQKEHSDSQYSSISSKTDELERKEAYLRDLEKELNRKEEEIRHNLKLGQTSEEKVKKDSDHKKEETAPITGFTPYCKVNRFSGIDPVPKSESSFEEWKIEIECMMSSKMYPDHVINQALRNSLTGQARTVAVTLGPKVTCQEIIDKLESVFGNVATGASVMQEFYTASQKVDESVTLWGIRIEQIVQRAVEKGYISPDQKNIMLKDRFWWYLYDDDLRNTTKIYYVQTDSFDLLRRKVKAEEYAMTVHNRSKLPPPVKRDDKSKSSVIQERKSSDSSVAAQHQPMLHDASSKLLKDLMEKVERLDSKVENINKGGKGGKDAHKSDKETSKKGPLNG